MPATVTKYPRIGQDTSGHEEIVYFHPLRPEFFINDDTGIFYGMLRGEESLPNQLVLSGG